MLPDRDLSRFAIESDDGATAWEILAGDAQQRVGERRDGLRLHDERPDRAARGLHSSASAPAIGPAAGSWSRRVF